MSAIFRYDTQKQKIIFADEFLPVNKIISAKIFIKMVLMSIHKPLLETRFVQRQQKNCKHTKIAIDMKSVEKLLSSVSTEND